MKQYLQIMKGTVGEYMMYRVNFLMWRLRMVMQILVTYFLWWAIFSQHKDLPAGRQELFGYTQSAILTYILLSSLLRTLILGTTTMDIGDIINSGKLSNYLVRPLNFFRYYIARDVADKGLNLFFAIFEVTFLIIILRPPIFFQTNPVWLLLTAIAVILGAALYFSFSFMLGFIGFWSPDIWAPRFLSFVIMEFFAGGLFPLDILPRPLFTLSQSLPFYYFLYFPLKIYLGQMALSAVWGGFAVGIIWILGFGYLLQLIWKKGLRMYAAEGR